MRIFGSLVVLAVLVIPTGVRAGDHQADAFMGASYLLAKGSTIKLLGWHASAAVNVPEQHRVGLILDVSGHFVGESDRTQITLMVGPRFTPLRDEKSPFHHFFAHALVFGVVHRSGGPQVGGATSGAVALGVGTDLPITRDDIWIPRIQADYLWTKGNDIGDGWRISAGLVYRLKE